MMMMMMVPRAKIWKCGEVKNKKMGNEQKGYNNNNNNDKNNTQLVMHRMSRKHIQIWM